MRGGEIDQAREVVEIVSMQNRYNFLYRQYEDGVTESLMTDRGVNESDTSKQRSETIMESGRRTLLKEIRTARLEDL